MTVSAFPGTSNGAIKNFRDAKIYANFDGFTVVDDVSKQNTYSWQHVDVFSCSRDRVTRHSHIQYIARIVIAHFKSLNSWTRWLPK